MGKKLAGTVLFAVLGAVQALVAAVQNVEITAANAYAYSADNPLVCDSGSQITVKHSYRADGRTMKEALIDFIQVTPAAAGDPDPWVSVRLIEGGLTNDVDFSEQPYLWLGSVTHGNAFNNGFYDVLEGIYEPYGDVYRFGYDGTLLTGEVGILVTNLVDNPVTGAPRSILMRGKGSTCLRTINGSVCTFSGTVTVEDGAYLTAQNASGISVSPRLIIRNGGRLVIKTTTASLPATTDVEIDGLAEFYISGGGTGPRFTINGSVCGNGTIKNLDQGGLAFFGTNNTFTGTVLLSNTSAGTTPLAVTIGDGTHFSWGGADVTGFSLPRHQLILNTTDDATFTGKLPSNGLVVKKGKGKVTLTQPIDRTAAVGGNLPAFLIEGGALVRGVAEETPLTGVMSLAGGTAFDLGGIACASCYLPYGGGSVVNPAPGSTTRFVGAGTNMLAFAGTLEGSVRLENVGTHPWKVMGDASIGGDVTLGDGFFLVDSFFTTTNKVTVEEGVRLLFSEDEYRHRLSMTGLAVDIWTGLDSAGSHEIFYTNCLSTIRGATPSVRTDMSCFSKGIHSGETTGNSDSDPFTQVLGGSKDRFCALFSGYFYAETDGEYSFSIRADDSGAVWVDDGLVVRCALGNSGTEVRGATNLTRGWHPIRVMFGEEAGLEVFIVKVKRPGDSAYVDIPLETLAAAVNPGTRIASLAGAGTIGLAEGGVWPILDDVSDFTGTVVANGCTAGDVGVLPLNSAQVAQDDDKDMFNGFWTLARRSVSIVTNGVRAIDFTPGEASVKGAVNTTDPIQLGQEWSVSFNYRAIRPRGGAMGDGFFVGVHGAGATAWDGGTFGYHENNQRLNEATAYGLQVYIYSSYSQLVWVNNKNIYAAPGPIVTNRSLIVWSKLDETPMRVTMSYDGAEKLVVSFRQGESVLAVTNAFAGADFATKFTGGTARIGIWGSNGGNYTRTLIDRLTFTSGAEVVAEPVLGGELEMRGGTVAAAPGSAEWTTLASALKVVGPATLDATSAALACTATEWSFDLDHADAALTVLGNVTFPAAVSLSLATTEPWPETPRLLADFSGYAGDVPSFSLSAEMPKSVRLSQRDGRLYVCKASGTAMIFR